ncbi:MAG: hypothetical protein WBQ73_04055 [Candidatus Babeliales bacterium]
METSSKTVKIVAYVVMGLWLLPINGMLCKGGRSLNVLTKKIFTQMRSFSDYAAQHKRYLKAYAPEGYMEKYYPHYLYNTVNSITVNKEDKNIQEPEEQKGSIDEKASPVKSEVNTPVLENVIGALVATTNLFTGKGSCLLEDNNTKYTDAVDSDSVEYDSDFEDECDSDSEGEYDSDSDIDVGSDSEDDVVDPVVSKPLVEAIDRSKQSKVNVTSGLLGKVRKGFVRVAYGDFGKRY